MWVYRSAVSLSKMITNGNLSMLGRSMFASSKKDLYQTLGVPKTASQNDIKKAYYKLAQQHHPDKNPTPGSKDKFAEISNAYQILSDDNKRKVYDQTGSAETSENYGQYGGFQDIFNQFRGAQGAGSNAGGMNFQDFFGDLFGMGAQGQKQNNLFQPEHILYNAQITFAESVTGTSRNVEYKKKEKCGTCNGTRAKPGTKPQKCTTCQGTGVQTLRQGIMVMQTPCAACRGEGTKITSYCGTCSGTGVQAKKATQQIKFPRGIDNNATLKFREKGHLGGDLVIKVVVRKHPTINRQGNDAHSDVEIPVVDAVLGTTLKVQTIYGKSKEVKISQGTQNGQKIRLPNEGFYLINTEQKGSHILTVKVKIPKNLKQQEKQLFQKLKGLQSNK